MTTAASLRRTGRYVQAGRGALVARPREGPGHTHTYTHAHRTARTARTAHGTPAAPPQVLPLLSITKKRDGRGQDPGRKRDGPGADILYPAGHYGIAGSIVAAIGTDSARYYLPWEAKNTSVIFWRGRPNSHTLSRWALPRLAVEGSAEERKLLDVSICVRHKPPTPASLSTV